MSEGFKWEWKPWGKRPGVTLCCLVCWLALSTASLQAADPSDAFADRPTFTTQTGDLTGTTSLSTREPAEPTHGGKQGGKSVWIRWIAEENGIVTFRTDGSAFDTLLSAYELKPGNEPPFMRLQQQARNDDSEIAPPASLIQFGAIQGHAYEIALDGRNGESGPFRLLWEFASVSKPPPVILSTPSDQAVRQGDLLQLSVDLIEGDSMKLSWFLNEDEILNEESSTLLIPSVGLADLGLYRLRIRVGNIRYFSSPIEIQINSEGATNALARNKLLDSLVSKFESDDSHGGPRLQDVGAGNTRGYNGSQIFNTFYATRDPAEPIHCGLGGGATYLFTYAPPADGQIYLDTVGSTYDTVLTVYTYTPPLNSYLELQQITCNNDGVGLGSASQLDFAALAGHNYVVVVDGVLGARGLARLNYRVDITQPPHPPTVQTAPPLSEVVVPGTTVRLELTTAGSPPLHYRWAKGSITLPGKTNTTLILTNFQASDAGEYRLNISSHIGEAQSPPIVLTLPALRLVSTATQLRFEVYVAPGSFCQLEYRNSLIHGEWLPLGEPLPGQETIQSIPLPLAEEPSRFYRVKP